MSKKLCYLVTILALVWSVNSATGQAPASAPGKGNILVERWQGGGVNNDLDSLKNNANFPDNPMTSFWAQEYDQPDIGSLDNWGERFRGYLWPPQTGEYTFWVASDDDSEVYLSTDDNPANMTLICSVEGWTTYRNFAGTDGSPGSNQKSKLIKLEAGKRYYTEAMFSDGTGGGHMSVAWGGPGIGAGPVVIAGKFLSALIRDPEPMFMASTPSPADGATGVVMPAITLLTWKKGATAVFHDVYFGTDPNPPKVARQAYEMFVDPTPMVPGTTYYWRVDEVESNMETIHQGNVWSFMAAPLSAFGPSPRNGDKWISTDGDLSWQPGTNAMQHDVYFGTDKDAVANRDASVKKGDKVAVPMLELPKLQEGTVYYWLVDEYDMTGAKHDGEVWSFTTNAPGGGVKAEYFRNMSLTGAPFLTQIEPAIDHTWGNDGPDAGVTDNFSARWTADLEIAVADTYTFIGTSDDGIRAWLNDVQIIDTWVDRGTTDSVSAPIRLEPGIYPLVVEYYENGGGAVAQFSWQTPAMARQIIPGGPLQPPVRAKATNPKNGDVNVPQDITLMWSSGEKAVTHNVYFGEDEAAVAAADASAFKGSQALENNTFTPGALEWNKTYYWRVDEVNDASAESPWKGAVWRFTTADFLVVEDFESYVDDVEGRIFQTWIDGWGYTEPAPGNPGNGTGATVGYIDPPFAEKSIVRGGTQSMPLAYNNADSPNYSETERTFASPQDWTVNGVNTLSLQVYGYPEVNEVTVTETGGKMSLTGAGADIWTTSDEFTFAFKTLNGDGSIVAKVTDIGTGANLWAKGGVMIRDSLDGGSAYAITALTGGDGSGACFQWRLTANTNAAWDGAGPVTPVAPPYWVKVERFGDAFTGYLSADGVSWQPQGTTQTIEMAAPVYIGIAVTSHQPNEYRTFQFEGIKTTGSVTGVWQGAEIMSQRYNSAQDLYVAIQDSTNKIAVVKDAAAVTTAGWNEVQIPLSSFTGVNTTRVKKLIIGIGDRNAPAADGTGMLFIDDIRVIKP